MNSNLPKANVQTVNLGFFKLKIDRSNARQASLLAQLPPRKKSKKEYFAEWDGWAQAGGSRENRTEAVGRMKAWLDNNQKNQPLDLSNLGLTSLPDTLPPNLRILYAYDNQLTSLPDTLPPNLRILRVIRNQLTSLPDTLALPNGCSVYIDGDRLSEATRNRVAEGIRQYLGTSGNYYLWSYNMGGERIIVKRVLMPRDQWPPLPGPAW